MNLRITGNNLDITPAIREHVTTKMDRATKSTDQIIGIAVVLSVQKIRHKAEVTLQLAGKSIFVEAEEPDLYAAVDVLVDKLERQLTKHKEKKTGHGHDRIQDHLELN